MLRFRTKVLLLSIFVFGTGIGLLSGLADGAYSAICLFVLPIVVALTGASVIADFGNPAVVTIKPVPALAETQTASMRQKARAQHG